MDFGAVSLNGYVGGAPAAPILSGSGLLSASEKQDSKDSSFINFEAPHRILKTSANSLPTTMLSFSSAAVDGAAPPETSLFVSQQGGYGSRGSNGPMTDLFSRCKDPFTPSQWLELELQALIYKYILANVSIPSHLLIQICKSLNPFLYVGSSSGSYAPNSFGWGTFHLGLSGGTDPEHGRCRRTDGKKWRCVKEAVPDQKYCERHINRGRHRSRKPVEGRNGQVVVGTSNTKSVPVASSLSALCSTGTSRSLGSTHHQFNSLQPTAANLSTDSVVDRMQVTQVQSVISPNLDFKSVDKQFTIPKRFGVVSSASLMYSSDKTSYSNPRNSESSLGFDDQETHHGQPLYQLMSGLPKNQSDCRTVSWPEEFKSDWRLSMSSVPTASSDFSSCSNSPRQDKFALTPLSQPDELDSINTRLGMHNDPIQKPTGWVPVPGGNSTGGPLGEVLKSIPGSVEANRALGKCRMATVSWDHCNISS